MMKRLKYLIVIVAAVILSGCATISRPYSREFSLVTTSKSATPIKETLSFAFAKQRTAIANDPNNGVLYSGLSDLLSLNKQYDEAITAAKRGIQLNPSNYYSFHALGTAYQAKGQYDDAIKAYKKAIAIGPRAGTYYMLGTAYWATMDYAEAARAFSRASELDEKNDHYMADLAIAYYRTGRYESALSAIDKAIDLKNYGMLGMRIKIEGVSRYSFNIAESVEAIKAKKSKWVTKACYVIEVEKDSPADKAGFKAGDKLIAIDKINLLDPATAANSSKNFFENYIKAKAPGTPVEVFRQGEKKSTKVILGRLNDPYLPYKLGVKAGILVRLGKNDQAVKYADEALDSRHAGKTYGGWAKVALGKISLGNGRYAEAIKLFSGVKGSATARILEATAYARKGNADKAIEIYLAMPEEKLSPKLSPKNVPLWKDRNDLMLALMPVANAHKENARQFETRGRFQQALEEYAGALALAADDKEKTAVRNEMFQMVRRMPRLPKLSEDAHKYAVRGELLVKEGEFKKAASEFKKASRLAPYSANLYRNTALVCEKDKDYAEAIRVMKIYLQAAPDAPNIQAAKDEIIRWELMLEQVKQGKTQ